MSRSLKDYLQKIIFILPALALIGVFVGYPFVASVFYSFTDWDGVATANFIGLKNYFDLLKDITFLHALKNTLFFTVATVLIINPLAMLLSLVFNSRIKGRTVLRTMFYIPVIISQLVVSNIWVLFLTYDGIFNKFLDVLGLGSFMVDWIGDYDKAPWIVVWVILWQGLGNSAVFYMAGLQGIPHELYEAAEIDGVNGVTRFTRITFPLLMPTVTVVTFLQLSGGLKLFDIPLILTNGGPGDVTTTITMTIFNQIFSYNTGGYATTTGIFLLLLTVLVSVVQLKVTRSREVEL